MSQDVVSSSEGLYRAPRKVAFEKGSVYAWMTAALVPFKVDSEAEGWLCALVTFVGTLMYLSVVLAVKTVSRVMWIAAKANLP